MKKAPLLITAMIGLASATFAQPPAATYVTFGEPVELNHLTTDQEDDVMGIISAGWIPQNCTRWPRTVGRAKSPPPPRKAALKRCG